MMLSYVEQIPSLYGVVSIQNFVNPHENTNPLRCFGNKYVATGVNWHKCWLNLWINTFLNDGKNKPAKIPCYFFRGNLS